MDDFTNGFIQALDETNILSAVGFAAPEPYGTGLSAVDGYIDVVRVPGNPQIPHWKITVAKSSGEVVEILTATPLTQGLLAAAIGITSAPISLAVFAAGGVAIVEFSSFTGDQTNDAVLDILTSPEFVKAEGSVAHTWNNTVVPSFNEARSNLASFFLDQIYESPQVPLISPIYTIQAGDTVWELAARAGWHNVDGSVDVNGFINAHPDNEYLINRSSGENGMILIRPGDTVRLITPEQADLYEDGELDDSDIYEFDADEIYGEEAQDTLLGAGGIDNLDLRFLEGGTNPDGSHYVKGIAWNGTIVTHTLATNGAFSTDYVDRNSQFGLQVEYSGIDTQGNPIGNPQVSLELPDATYAAGQIGGIFGSQFGQMLGGNNVFTRIGAATVGSAIGKEVFGNIANINESLLGQGEFTESVLTALRDIGSNVITSLPTQTATVLGSILFAEAGEALGLDGFAGKVFSLTGGTITGNLTENLILNGSSALSTDALLNALNVTEIVKGAGGLLGTYIGSEYVNDINSTGEALFAAVGSSYGGIVGGGIGAAAAGIGSVTGVAASISTAVGASVGAFATTALAAVLLPFIGAAIGALLGQTIGNKIFDFIDFNTGGWLGDLLERLTDVDPKHQVYVRFDAASNQLIRDYDTSDDTTEELREGTYSFTDAYRDIVNSVISQIGRADSAAFVQVNSRGDTHYDHAWFAFDEDNEYRVILGQRDVGVEIRAADIMKPNAEGVMERDTAALIRIAAEYELSRMHFYAGDVLKLRAFEAWKASIDPADRGGSLDTLLSYLNLAEDYAQYMEQSAQINALAKALPDSAFATGWVATLLQAEALGLNDPYIIGYGLPGADGAATTFAETITSGDGSDLIYADGGNDVVKSYAGNDTINGGPGNDTIMLGNGNDQVWAETGNDSIDGGAGNDLMDGGAGADTLNGGAGDDTVTYNGSSVGIIVALNGTLGQNGDAAGDQLVSVEVLVASAFNDQLTGSSSKDTIYAGDGADSVNGAEGADLLFAEGGNDTVISGAGDDTVFAWTGNDRVDGNEGADQLSGEQGDDSLSGGDGNDSLYGDDPASAGLDTLSGNAGNDLLEGGAGDDSLSGDEDNDTIYASLGNDIIFGGSGVDSLYGDAGDDSIDGGTEADKVFAGDGDDLVLGDDGNDNLYGDYGNDTLIGGIGNDILFGYDGADSIEGGDGDDVLAGEAGDDTISGGDGKDVIYSDGPGASGIDLIYGGDDNDIVKSGDLDDTIYGDGGNDTLFAEQGNDVIYGGSGDDSINAGDGDDTIFGQSGNDTLIAFDGADRVSGDAGNDLLYGLAGNDTITGSVGEDTIYGDTGNDLMVGGDGNDFIDGWRENDVLAGALGDDTLAGGDHNDYLAGDDGNDVLYGDRQPDPNALPSSEAEILQKILINPGYNSWGLLYQGEQYTVGQLRAAPHEMLVINPSKDSLTNIPQSEIAWTAEEISQIKETHTAVFGYVNLAKMNSFLAEWDSGWTDNGLANGEASGTAPSWFDESESSTTRLVKFWDEDWQNIVLDRVTKMIDQGFQGAMLDDALEYFFRVPEELTGSELEQAISENAVEMRDFILRIREHADNLTIQEYGAVTLQNKFKLLVNGAPYIMKDAILDDDILSDAGNTAYLEAIDGIIIENYFSRNETLFIDDTIRYFPNNVVPVLSIDTDMVTLQQRAQIITDSVNKGFLPYTTENSSYDTLNDTFLAEIAAAAIITNGNDTLLGGAGDDRLEGGGGDDSLEGGSGADIINGGDGIDWLSYAESLAAVNVNLTANAHTGGDAEGDSISGVENLIGSSFNDTLAGDAGDNSIIAGNGDDAIVATDGADTIDGGQGIDTYTYTSSTVAVDASLASGYLYNMENLTGSIYNDTLSGDAGDNSILASTGNDLILATAGMDTVHGGSGIDTYSFENYSSGVTTSLTDTNILSIENLIGSAYNDILTGSTGNNYIFGGDGDDAIVGTAGVDTIDGGAGLDLYSFSNSAIAVNVSLASAAISDIENLIGSIYNDTLEGDEGNNSILASTGNDLIFATSGIDTVHGGSGIDTYSFANYAEAINVTLTDANILSIENLIGSNYNDTLTGSSGNNSIIGGAGNDLIMATAGNDTVDGGSGLDTYSLANLAAAASVTLGISTVLNMENLIGSNYNDTLVGSSGNNSIIGGIGDDLILATTGQDTIDGGTGTDTYSFASYATAANASLENPNIFSIERLVGSTHNDTLSGNASDNYIAGGDGDDAIIGTLGQDTIDGGNGLDTYTFTSSATAVNISLANANISNIENLTGSVYNDTLEGNSGNNSILASTGNDLIYATLGMDTVHGGSGIDTYSFEHYTNGINVALTDSTILSIENLVGSSYNDTLTGTSGNNTIWGGSGNDLITGGNGIDILSGGTGTDTFIYNTNADSGNAAGQRDIISDFSINQDIIDLSSFAGTFAFRGTSAFSGSVSQINYTKTGNITVVNVDSNGDNTGDFQIELVGAFDLSTNDFFL